MKKGLTHIGIVLDRSGSMGDICNATIEGFNAFLKEQKAVPGEATVYWAKFDTEYEVQFEGNLKDAPLLNRDNFQPRGGTALLDAMGWTIDHIGKGLKAMPEHQRPEKVVMVIMTDGYENSSRHYKKSQIRAMVEHQRDAYKWEFVFLGANQDAVLVGADMGIPASHSVMYAATAGGTRTTVTSTSSNLASYRTGQAVNMAYSDKQKADALDNQDIDEHGNIKSTPIGGTGGKA